MRASVGLTNNDTAPNGKSSLGLSKLTVSSSNGSHYSMRYGTTATSSTTSLNSCLNDLSEGQDEKSASQRPLARAGAELQDHALGKPSIDDGCSQGSQNPLFGEYAKLNLRISQIPCFDNEEVVEGQTYKQKGKGKENLQENPDNGDTFVFALSNGSGRAG